MSDPDDDQPTGEPLPPPPVGADPSGDVPVPDPLGGHDGEPAIEDAEVVGPDDAAEDPDEDPDDPVVPDAADDDEAVASRPPHRRLPAGEPARSLVIAGAAAGSVLVVGLLGALVFGGGGLDAPTSGPSDPAAVSSEPATTPVATTAPVPTGPPTTPAPPDPPTTPAATDPPTTPTQPPGDPATTVGPSTTVGASVTTLLADPSATTTTVTGTLQVVRSVVPDIAAFTEVLDEVAQARTIAELSQIERNDIASPGPVGSLCAVVRLQEQSQLEGRWERNGGEVDTTNLSTVGEPGFGDCLVGEGGAPLEEGTYQFVVADREGNDSAAGTFVVGAVPLEQVFVNTSSENVCVLRVGPSGAGRYDAYDFTSAPLGPGASVVVAIADVDQDVRVDDCDGESDPLAEFDFNPAAGVPQSLRPS